MCGGGGGGLQMTGANNAMTGPEIGNFQNNGNLGNAANLDMVFMGRGVWGAVLLFIPYLWISKIHFDIHNSFLDIQNRFMDILKYIFGYPKSS